MDTTHQNGPPPLARPAAPAEDLDAPRKTLLELATALQMRITQRDLERYLVLRRFFRHRLERDSFR